MKLKDIALVASKDELRNITDGKTLVNTINAYSFVVAQNDGLFAESLSKCICPAGSHLCFSLPGTLDTEEVKGNGV